MAPDSPSDQLRRVEEAAERIFQNGILDEIYDHAYNEARGIQQKGRDAWDDATAIASLVFDDVDSWCERCGLKHAMRGQIEPCAGCGGERFVFRPPASDEQELRSE